MRQLVLSLSIVAMAASTYACSLALDYGALGAGGAGGAGGASTTTSTTVSSTKATVSSSSSTGGGDAGSPERVFGDPDLQDVRAGPGFALTSRVTDGGLAEVTKIDEDGGGTSACADYGRPGQLTFDDQKAYWADYGGSVRRRSLDTFGPGYSDLGDQAVCNLRAIDQRGTQVFTAGCNYVHARAKDGSDAGNWNAKPGGTMPSIAVSDSYVFWVARSSGVWAVNRMHLDSSGQDLNWWTNQDGASPRWVAVDDHYVYAVFDLDADAGPSATGTIWRRSLTSFVPERIATGLTAPLRISTDGNFVYWTEPGAAAGQGSIWRTPSDPATGGPEEMASGRYDPTSVAVNGIYVYWLEHDLPNGGADGVFRLPK